MTLPYPPTAQPPSAVFSGALGDHVSGGWFPAQAEVSNGFITLWVALPNGWTQYFSVPAQEVVVKSAAQRITLVVRGQNYVLLADARSVKRALRLGIAGGVASVLDKPRFGVGVDLGRAINVAGGARSFQLGGGPEFLAAAQHTGARTSRVGYGPILGIGIGCGALVVVGVTIITLIAINL
ncbi:hypothetical protein [Humidisolicoccus flavus]|uniref:hypothetical protein n=1 Tax=Humidisolicoccus flavus TaxID=3111414 RepID=UPI0032488724